MVCKQIFGDIFDREYRNSQTCIVHQCNCVALKPDGLSRHIILTLGNYANIYSSRKAISRNIATIDARYEPGTIKVCRGSPNIIALFGQFLFGKSSPRLQLRWGKCIIGKIDSHFDKGFLSDTQGNRLLYFRNGLTNLLKYLIQHNRDDDTNLKRVRTIIFPYKIGCGRTGGKWKKYKKEIRRFAKQLSLSSKRSKCIPYNVYILKKD